MIYVISKSTYGSYNVRDIQCNANWDCCPYSDYALIPDSMVEGILATQGYCDITLNAAGNMVEAFAAREIPSVPHECCGTNTVLSVNGVCANADGEVTLNAADVGARPDTWMPSASDVGAAHSDVYKYFPLSATTSYGWLITDALHIHTINPMDALNRPGYVYNGVTGQIPDGLSNGIREVFYYSPEWIIVKITGWDSVNYRPCAVYNQFRGFNIGWTGWEWDNPPMVLGVEYLTTERHKGNPVYVKAVELNLAGSGFKSVHVAAGITEVVSMEGSYYQEWGGVLSEKTVNPSTVQLNLASGSLQINSSDMSSTTAKYIVKYTK